MPEAVSQRRQSEFSQTPGSLRSWRVPGVAPAQLTCELETATLRTGGCRSKVRASLRRLEQYVWPLVGVAILLGGCEPADVEVLPLPSLQRPSAEARLGLPEIAGTWRFAGWEIIEGDSTTLARTFPSFGELRIETQRLDSIAGTFVLAGGATPVIGGVTREGLVSVVTLPNGVATSFVAGRVAADTLWLELTSVMPPDEWPRDARAAFVRGATAEPLAWLRGFNPSFAPDPPAVDTLPAVVDSLAPTPGQSIGSASPDGAAASAPAGQLPGGGGAPVRAPATGGRSGQQPAANSAQPSQTRPNGNVQTPPANRTAPTQPARPATPPPSRPDPSLQRDQLDNPAGPPGQGPRPPDPEAPDDQEILLGEPVGQEVD